MNFEEILGNEQLLSTVLQFVVIVAGGLWAALQSSALYKKHMTDPKALTAIHAIEEGVQETYDDFVKDLKAAASDGRLTQKEVFEARKRAQKAATVIAQTNGIDLAKTLGTQSISVIMEEVIRKFKGNV